jgi:hypothetical protein
MTFQRSGRFNHIGKIISFMSSYLTHFIPFLYYFHAFKAIPLLFFLSHSYLSVVSFSPPSSLSLLYVNTVLYYILSYFNAFCKVHSFCGCKETKTHTHKEVKKNMHTNRCMSFYTYRRSKKKKTCTQMGVQAFTLTEDVKVCT